MKILVLNDIGSKPLSITSSHIDKIKSLNSNIEVDLVSMDKKEEILAKAEAADVIAGQPHLIPSIAKLKNLKWIQSFSAGADAILTPEVVNSNLIVTNVSGIHATPIAEHVLGYILIFTKRFYDTFKKQQEKIWEANQDLTELREKTVLVVGLGHIGTEIARLANCFGANAVGVKHNLLKNRPDFVSEVYPIDHLDNILPKADFVVLSLPLTPETKHLFDMKKFEKMKKSGVLINIGRGALIKEDDLIEALEQKIIAGAALDVTEEEPLPKKSKLWEMENVVITPHHSGLSEKYMDRAIDLFCINLKAYIKGERLPNLVDKKRGY